MSSRCGFPDVASQLPARFLHCCLVVVHLSRNSGFPVVYQTWFPNFLSIASQAMIRSRHCFPAVSLNLSSNIPKFLPLVSRFYPSCLQVISQMLSPTCPQLSPACLADVVFQLSPNCLPVCSGVASAVFHFPPPTPSCLPDVPRITLHCLPLGLPIASLSLEFETVIAKLAGLFARILCCSDCQPVKDQ